MTKLKILTLYPLVAFIMLALLPQAGSGEGTFTLVSAETGPGGAPIPLNHTVEVGHSTLYRARAINGLNRSVTVTFLTTGLPEGASAVITPSQATLGEGGELIVEVLLTLTGNLKYTTGKTTFELQAMEGDTVLDALPVTFIPVFRANFTAAWEGSGERAELIGFTGQKLFMSINIVNLASFRDDILLDVVSTPSWAEVTLTGGEDSTVLTLSPGEMRSVSVLVDLKDVGEGEAILRATSIASLHQKNEIWVNLFLNIRAMEELPLQINLNVDEIWLVEGSPEDVSAEVWNPNPHHLSVYMTASVEGEIEESFLQVTLTPEEIVDLEPGGEAVWAISVELTGPQSYSGWGILKLRLWSQGGELLGEGVVMLHIRPSPDLSIHVDPLPALTPSGRGVMNITITNTGNCPVMGLLYAEDVPEGLMLLIPVRLYELNPGERVDLKAEVMAAENITPGSTAMTLLFSGYYLDSAIHPYIENVTFVVEVVGQPHLVVGFINERGYLLVNQSEDCTVEVYVRNDGTLTSSQVVVELYEVSRSLSRQPVSSAVHPPLSPGENSTFSFHLTPSPSTVRLEVVARSGEDTASAQIPVTVYTRTPLPGGSSTPGGIPGGVAAAAAMVSAAGGAALAVLLSRNEGVQLAFHKALIPLYSKLSSDEILNNKIRREIYQYIRNHPGEHFRSILLNLGLTNGTLAYHLYTLEKEELIKSRKDGLYRRFYPTGYKVEPVIPTNGMGRIYRLIVSEPGITQKEISESLGIPSSSVNYSVKKLKRQGLIEIRRDGRYTRLYPSHKGG